LRISRGLSCKIETPISVLGGLRAIIFPRVPPECLVIAAEGKSDGIFVGT